MREEIALEFEESAAEEDKRFKLDFDKFVANLSVLSETELYRNFVKYESVKLSNLLVDKYKY